MTEKNNWVSQNTWNTYRLSYISLLYSSILVQVIGGTQYILNTVSLLFFCLYCYVLLEPQHRGSGNSISNVLCAFQFVCVFSPMLLLHFAPQSHRRENKQPVWTIMSYLKAPQERAIMLVLCFAAKAIMVMFLSVATGGQWKKIPSCSIPCTQKERE